MKKIYTILIIIICHSSIAFSQTWDSLGTGLGISGESVKAIAVDPLGNIYAGGTFTGTYNYLAKWNASNSAWENVGTGVNGPVYAIAIKTASDIYIGGLFSLAGGVAVNNFARWDGSAFSDVGGGFNGKVKCIYIENSLQNPIFVGGEFSQSGANTMNHIAKLVSGNWTQLGSGIGSFVNAIVENGTAATLYAGTDNQSNPVQMFDGSSWTTVTGLTSGKVFALASYNDELYAGGDFNSPTPAAAKYDGTQWGTISTLFGVSDVIYSMFVRAGVLYVGGTFLNLGPTGYKASYVGRKTTSLNPIISITSQSSVLNDTVFAIGNKSGRVIVGGAFTSPQNHIAITNTTIGIDEISSIVTEKNFYPNPVKDKAQLVVSTSVKMKKPELQIFDMQSRLISEIKISQEIHQNEVKFSFDCSSLPKGNYFYVLSEENKGILSDIFIVE